MQYEQNHHRREPEGMTRRQWCGLTGLAIASIAIPSSVVIAQESPGTATSRSDTKVTATGNATSLVMEKLSTYMSEAEGRALPQATIEATKQHVLDTLAAMISGADLLPGRTAIDFARAYSGKEVATVVASRILCGPIEAALTNGMLAHADETDDSHSPSQSHLGCGVVPAALAAGEQFGISGTHFLRAVTLGYDIGSRFTMTLGGQKFEFGSHWSTHSIAPLFGAAAAASCAARFKAQQMRWLLGYAAQQSSGLASWNRDTQHIQKAFVFGGMPARSGVTAALLVHGGYTGVDDLLSGANNFFEAYNPKADPAGLIGSLGERYEITRTNIKKWSVGSPIQAVLDGLEILHQQRRFTADQVQQVTVRLATDEAAIVNNREIPDICLQHMVAVMLLDHTVTFNSAHDVARMKDPATLQARAKVKLVPDQQLERLMPLRVAITEVDLSDGTRLSQRVDNVRGTPENPMSREEVIDKARDLMTPVLGSINSSALIEKVFQLESVRDIRELRPLLQRT